MTVLHIAGHVLYKTYNNDRPDAADDYYHNSTHRIWTRFMCVVIHLIVRPHPLTLGVFVHPAAWTWNSLHLHQTNQTDQNCPMLQQLAFVIHDLSIPNFTMPCISWSHLGLPVPANITPAAIRRNTRTDKLLSNTENHSNWPLYADMINHSTQRLASCHPIWADSAPADTRTQWEEEWLLASAVNNLLICDPTIPQPGFVLLHHWWSLMNCFCMGWTFLLNWLPQMALCHITALSLPL